ncbi:hypothetical protein DDB_G0276449 [Dictyostelium discoideum AX4]|uniref:RNA-binding S4 domain-containing protein n=1 Tax=Dictyostelium discoideum TaxID=44689 RepID=Q8T866_DICDI|nr:hypothetical protein DDB_G0276449 [Dictyostelium discoideum AX4]EAL69178.1 hypothetical protein DDB_G0276449 [Dictyostelium discoideum AX4]|eukprot:XP_643151.1 hypothetical protein DDB_G0276449 [Dictyostelium discoideum AX4]
MFKLNNCFNILGRYKANIPLGPSSLSLTILKQNVQSFSSLFINQTTPSSLIQSSLLNYSTSKKIPRLDKIGSYLKKLRRDKFREQKLAKKQGELNEKDMKKDGYPEISFWSKDAEKIKENDFIKKGEGFVEDGKIGTERIQKILARAGIASRRKAEELIIDGRVKVNGKIIKMEEILVKPHDIITVDDKPIKVDKPKIWMHFKNPQVLTSEYDPDGRDCLLPIIRKVIGIDHLISVGRLDYYTEGLILFTNDGELARYLTLPQNLFFRVYKVRIFGKFTDEMKFSLAKGMVINEVFYRPVSVQVESETDSNTWLRITLQEGKKREIRTLLEYFNVKVLRLIRVAYGPYVLPNSLKHGETIEVPIKDELKPFINKYNSTERLKKTLQEQKKIENFNKNNVNK